MQLLHTTSLKLERFPGRHVPPYAILSHTWGNQEVLFEDLRHGADPRVKAMEGFAKIEGSCKLARNHGYEYIWIDTCCIDKSSSAELSESINSMFSWYLESSVCYVYLDDVNKYHSLSSLSKRGKLVSWYASRWFTRGWTLQELIAPAKVLFYDSSWLLLGNKVDMSEGISRKTGVPMRILVQNRNQKTVGDCPYCFPGPRGFLRVGPDTQACLHNRVGQTDLRQALDGCSIAERFSWASTRETTREEDIAYCLLGIFNVNMPLLYGEGNRAFLRLQEEIIKQSDDQTILAFARKGTQWPTEEQDSLLAESPSQFLSSWNGNLIPAPHLGGFMMSLNTKVVETTLSMCRLTVREVQNGVTKASDSPYWLGALHCVPRNGYLVYPAIILQEVGPNQLLFQRVHSYRLEEVTFKTTEVCLSREWQRKPTNGSERRPGWYYVDQDTWVEKKVGLLLMSRPHQSTMGDDTILSKRPMGVTLSATPRKYREHTLFPGPLLVTREDEMEAVPYHLGSATFHTKAVVWIQTGMLQWADHGIEDLSFCVFCGVMEDQIMKGAMWAPWCILLNWDVVVEKHHGPYDRTAMKRDIRHRRQYIKDWLWKNSGAIISTRYDGSEPTWVHEAPWSEDKYIFIRSGAQELVEYTVKVTQREFLGRHAVLQLDLT